MSRWQLDKQKYLTHKEIEKLFSTLQKLESQDRAKFRCRWCIAHMALLLTYNLGLRVSELRVKHKALDLQSELPSIFILGKRKRKRYIPIPHHLKQHIERFIVLKESWGQSTEPESYFLQSPKGGCYSIGGLEQMFLSAMKEAQLPRRTIHALRHSFGFSIYNQTKDLRATQQLLGHSSISTTQIYTYCTFDKLSSYVNQI